MSLSCRRSPTPLGMCCSDEAVFARLTLPSQSTRGARHAGTKTPRHECGRRRRLMHCLGPRGLPF